MRAFIDTNVAVYRYANDDPQRRAVAERLFDELNARDDIVFSTQVLMETFHTLVNKKRVSVQGALAAVNALALFEVVSPTAQAALAACELAAAHSVSVWDAFIIHAALQAECDVLYSEDLQHGRRFGTLEVVNPFSASAHEAHAAYGSVKQAAAKPAAPGAKTSPRKPAKPAAPSKRRRG